MTVGTLLSIGITKGWVWVIILETNRPQRSWKEKLNHRTFFYFLYQHLILDHEITVTFSETLKGKVALSEDLRQMMVHHENKEDWRVVGENRRD